MNKDKNPFSSLANEIFDFESRQGLAMIRPEIAKRLTEEYKKGQAQQTAETARQFGKTATMSTPPQSDWTAEDLANQKRVADDIERALERHYAWMVVWVCVAGAALGVAIHFLSTP